MNWVEVSDQQELEYKTNGWTPQGEFKLNYMFTEYEIICDMNEVFDYIFKMNEEEYSLQVDNMLHMLVNEGIVIDERTGQEVYIDPFTFIHSHSRIIHRSLLFTHHELVTMKTFQYCVEMFIEHSILKTRF